MSGREGHDALALQRLHVLRLLGAVTGEVEDGGCENIRAAEDVKEDMTKHCKAAKDIEDGISDHSRAADDIEDGISDHRRAADDVEDDTGEHLSKGTDDVEDDTGEHLSKGTDDVEDGMSEHYCRSTKDSLANVKSNFQHKNFKRKSGFVHNNLHSNDLHVGAEESNSSDLISCKKQKHQSSEHVSCSSYSLSQADHSSESGSSLSVNSSYSSIHIKSSFTSGENDVCNNTVKNAGECEITNNHTSSEQIYDKHQTNTPEVCINVSTAEERSSPAVNKEKATSECMEDLLKRARAFSSQRVEITDSMFTGVTEMNYKCANSLVEPLSKQQYIQTCYEASISVPERMLTKDVNINAVFDRSELRASACDSWQYNLCSPTMVAEYGHHYRAGNNYTKGCKWSPDGELLLVLSADQKLRLFDLPATLSGKTTEQGQCERDQPPALTITEGEMVYDFTWYPLMNMQDPDTCIMVCSCRGLPMHMWDCVTGQLVCSYRPFNHLDELAPALSLGFSRDGAQLVCGFNKTIRLFETARPGRTCRELCAKRQNGIISCFDFHPYLHNVLAAGSYLGSVGLYSTGTGKVFSILEGHRGGLTQLCFSDDGLRLYTGARKDPELLCWDVRQLGRVLSSHRRVVDTHQRVSFALATDGRTLISGSTDGRVLSWRTGPVEADGQEAADCFVAHDDCVNGVSTHPRLPLLATCSGQRRAAPHPDDVALGCADPAADALTVATPASVRLWRLRSPL